MNAKTLAALHAKTLTALHKSIAKWERIYRYGAKDKGYIDCPLCALFYQPHCDGCPVKKMTTQEDCWGSPYMDVPNRTDPGYRRAARAEYEFLKSLLPKGKP